MENWEILVKLRKGKVLTPAHFGCLEGIPTLNITSGCIFQCAYCYARGYSQAPEKGAIHLYVNLPRLLEEELFRKKVIPSWVILNTSSDCFQTHPDILSVTYEVMRILLDHGIGISFLTKGIIPQGFFNLFSRSPGKISAQIGLVSFSERYWKGYEPHTPSPEQRTENIRKLKGIGISPEIRIDPIIPFVTDGETDMMFFFERLKGLGVKRVTLSYLHLRPAIERQLMKELSPLHQKLMASCFKTQEWKVIGSSSRTKILPKPIRERGYERIKEIAQRLGITALVCQCKNPDVQGDLCSAGRKRTALGKRETPAQLPLFRC
jgi:DNA repair photolyase